MLDQSIEERHHMIYAGDESKHNSPWYGGWETYAGL